MRKSRTSLVMLTLGWRLSCRSRNRAAAGVFVSGRDGTLPFFDAGGVQPVYAFQVAEVGVRQPLHHRSAGPN